MKVAYYTDQTYLHGGLERSLSNKINYLSLRTDFEIYVITIEQKNNAPCYPIQESVIQHDLEINYNRKLSYLNYYNLRKVPRHFKRLKRKIKEINPDVLIVCNYEFGFYFIPFISKGIKTIKEFHSSRHDYAKGLSKAPILTRFLYRVNTWVEKKYTHIVVLNNDEKKYYKSNTIKVIPNAVCNIELTNTIKRKNTIIAAGRIAPVKQFDHLIKAWSLIAKKNKNWEVHIYGEGNEMLLKELETLIYESQIPNIQFMGGTENLPEKMQEASIYALTSAMECFPMVLLESLACGLPIVSYNCPHGPKNIMKDGEDGFLIEHNNMQDFANKMHLLMNDEKLRNKMSKKALHNIRRFKEEILMKQWEDLFKI